MRIHVLGAGAWGTAVAIAAARHPAGHAVSLFARNAEQVQTMQANRANAAIGFDPGLKVVADFQFVIERFFVAGVFI